MDQLAERVAKIEARNRRVEADKAWETSHTRRLLLVLTTYFIMTLVMFSLGVSSPFINAVIPTLGFFLSTLSLPIVKGYWLEHFYKK